MSDLISRSAALNATKLVYVECLYEDEWVYAEGEADDVDVVFAKDIRALPAVDAVPIDDMFCEMMNWAVRYALGRRTYAASDTAMYILPLVPKLDDKTLTVIAQDIRERGENLGDECDAVWWRRLLESVIAEMVRRKDDDRFADSYNQELRQK